MKKSLKLFKAGLLVLAAIAAAYLLAPAATGIAQNVNCYMSQGGSSWTVGSGCTLNVASGGVLSFAGVDQTAALATAPAAVAAGYKIARGETALDGSNPTDIATGLTTIVACAATIKATATPGVSTSVITYGSSGATLSLYGWKVTNSSTTTMIASTGTDTIGWVCLGT